MKFARHLFLAVSLASLTVPSAAQAGDEGIFALDSAELVSDDILDEQRGGFRFNGIEVAVGAEFRSYIADNLVVQTNISWINSQADIQQVVADGVTPLSAADLQTLLGGSGLGSNLGTGSAFLTGDGNTAFIQRADAVLQNIIVNSASNLDIRQQLDVTIDIANFAPFQADMISDRVGTALVSMINAAGVGF